MTPHIPSARLRGACRLLIGVAVLAAAALVGGRVPAVAADSGCGDLVVVFARGSGQRLAQREGTTFLSALSARLGGSVRATAYELGSATYGGARYPAVGVGVDSGDAFANLLDAGAFWTGNEGHRYRASVGSGVRELRAYLERRAQTCPAERVVLGGYSQGAQVVGDALPGISRELRDRITFVGLFGDPKLSLPEGRGIFPAACRGRALSPWRRGNASCYTDNGILDARTPYLPADVAARTGSWCDRDDPICNGNLGDFLRSTHSRYAQPGRAVDQAAGEAATAVRRALGDRPADPARSGAPDPGPARSGSPGPGPARSGAPGPVSYRPASPGPVSPLPPRPSAPLPSTQLSAAPGPASPGSASPGAASPGSASPGPASPAPVPPGSASSAGRAPTGRAAAALVIDEYWTSPGSPVTFDASASALPPTAVAAYRWDFDGDGRTDRTTRGPVVDHIYRAPFTGRARLRLSAADGAEALADAPVHVDRAGLTPRLPSGPSGVTVRAGHGADGAVVRWSTGAPGTTTGPVGAWRVHDEAGRLLAHVPGSARQADLVSLPDRTTALTVEAVNEYGSSPPWLAAPRGAGSSRFTATSTGRNGRAATGGNPEPGGRPNRSVPVVDGAPAVSGTDGAGPRPEPTTGLVAAAATLLLATSGTLLVRGLRTGSPAVPGAAGTGGRHRRTRRP